MNKKLAFWPTRSPEAAFVIVAGLTETDDIIGTYSADGYCRGAADIKSYTIGVNAHGNDFDSERKDGFDFDEEIFLFYYSSTHDKFYKLHGTVINYALQTPVQTMTYGPLSLYKLVNPVIGEEIQLKVDEELTKEILQFNEMPDEWKTGDDPTVELDFTQFNVKDLEVNLISGNGKLHKQVHWPLKWVYEINAQDTTVQIEIKGKGIFEGGDVQDLYAFDVEIEQQGDAFFSNSEITFYEDNGNLIIKANASQVAAVFNGRYNMKLWTNTKDKRVVSTIQRMKQFYSLNRKTLTGTYRVKEGRAWGADKPFTFDV